MLKWNDTFFSNGSPQFEETLSARKLALMFESLENCLPSIFQHMLKIISRESLQIHKEKFNVGKSRIFPHYLNEEKFSFSYSTCRLYVAVEIRIANKNIAE
jgi:Zn-dependent M32 family carboxypeptidase